MFIEDYGLWLTLHEYLPDAKGRFGIGKAWKTPIAPTLPIGAKLHQVITTQDLKELLSTCKDKHGYGWLEIKNNGEPYNFLIETISSLDHAKIISLLSADTSEGAKLLHKIFIEKYGTVPNNSTEFGSEEHLRKLFYEKFGIDMP